MQAFRGTAGAHHNTPLGRVERCGVRATFSGAIHCDSHVMEHLFNPLNTGWDGTTARHPYLGPGLLVETSGDFFQIVDDEANSSAGVLDGGEPVRLRQDGD